MKGATADTPAKSFKDDLISIHAPVKGATEARHQEAGRTYDFNPRTREGCDDDRTLDAVLAVGISIHAPVKGATIVFVVHGSHALFISIHAPVKGATRQEVMQFAQSLEISIHAPVKGATRSAILLIFK